MPSCGLACATASSSCAVEHDSTTRPRRIGPCASCGGEDRVAGVVDPRLPEEEALLLVARRVVGGRVEQPVDDAERARQVGRRRRQVAHRRAQLLDRRQRRARERADLVADDRRRLAQERPRLAQRRRRARAPPGRSDSSVGPEHVGERLDLAQRRLRRLQRPRQLLQDQPQRRVLVGQRRRTPRWSSARSSRAACRACRARRSAARSCARRARGSRRRSASPSLISRAYFAVGSSRRIACASSRPLRSEPEALARRR